MEEITKNCRGVKSCHDDINRMEKIGQRNNFVTFLGFKECEIFESEECTIVKNIKKNIPK